MTHEHLNDEQLSAHLDGELHGDSSPATTPDDTAASGIDGCEACQARLAALAGARALVRRPVVPVAPSVRAAAVEAALIAGLGAGDPGIADRGTGSVSTLAPRSTRPARFTGVLVGVAASVAVLVVVVGVSLGQSHSGPSSTASSALAHAPARAEAPEPTTTSPGGVPDLGSVTSTSLRSRLAPLLGAEGRVSGTSGTSFAPGTPSENATAAVPSATGASPVAPSACVSAAHQVAGAAAPPELLATATYAHTPAFVFVVPVGASPTGTTGDEAVVVSQSGCRVLAHTTS
jgi:hypothetical protein